MTRDYSSFFTGPGAAAPRAASPLETLGWQPFFAQQSSVDELAATPPVRVVEVHRNGLHVMGDGIDAVIPPRPDATAGDWLLLDRARPRDSRLLARKSLLKRRAPGSDRQVQLIAANIDTAFIVTSCNADFNIARLERYVALAFEADIAPVILLTKSDLCDDPEAYASRAAAISDRVPVVTLDARGPEPVAKLAPWCGKGQTVAFLGSSGIGKSTLTNALAGEEGAPVLGHPDPEAPGPATGSAASSQPDPEPVRSGGSGPGRRQLLVDPDADATARPRLSENGRAPVSDRPASSEVTEQRRAPPQDVGSRQSPRLDEVASRQPSSPQGIASRQPPRPDAAAFRQFPTPQGATSRQPVPTQTIAPQSSATQPIATQPIATRPAAAPPIATRPAAPPPIATQPIREDDAKGRHTTTRRQLHPVPSGCLVLDTPGMRELQLTDAATGIDDLFADISDLAARCRFGDCRHDTEPGCAVSAAIEGGTLDPDRLRRWRKLLAEDAHNSASLAERRRRDRAFGKMVREVQAMKPRNRRS